MLLTQVKSWEDKGTYSFFCYISQIARVWIIFLVVNCAHWVFLCNNRTKTFVVQKVFGNYVKLIWIKLMSFSLMQYSFSVQWFLKNFLFKSNGILPNIQTFWTTKYFLWKVTFGNFHALNVLSCNIRIKLFPYCPIFIARFLEGVIKFTQPFYW